MAHTLSQAHSTRRRAPPCPVRQRRRKADAPCRRWPAADPARGYATMLQVAGALEFAFYNRCTCRMDSARPAPQPGHRQTLSQHRQTPGQTVVKQTSGNEQAHVRLSRLTALPPSLSPLRTPLEVPHVPNGAPRCPSGACTTGLSARNGAHDSRRLLQSPPPEDVSDEGAALA